jgi:hypothetical protein
MAGVRPKTTPMIYCSAFTDYYLVRLSTSFIGDSHYESFILEIVYFRWLKSLKP